MCGSANKWVKSEADKMRAIKKRLKDDMIRNNPNPNPNPNPNCLIRKTQAAKSEMQAQWAAYQVVREIVTLTLTLTVTVTALDRLCGTNLTSANTRRLS